MSPSYIYIVYIWKENASADADADANASAMPMHAKLRQTVTACVASSPPTANTTLLTPFNR
jgi:hypothetical protein